MRDGFIKVAAGTPRIRVADCHYNAEQIFTMMREADQQGVPGAMPCPELCLTGYTCGDLFLQDTLLRGAEEGLNTFWSQPEPGSGDRRGAAGAGQVGRQAVQLCCLDPTGRDFGPGP